MGGRGLRLRRRYERNPEHFTVAQRGDLGNVEGRALAPDEFEAHLARDPSCSSTEHEHPLLRRLARALHADLTIELTPHHEAA